MKKFTIISILSSLLFINTSCDDYLDVNNNVDAPDYVEGYLYLANIIQQYQGTYWDVRALAPLTQMMGSSGYSNFANNYYSIASDAGGEMWRVVYWNQGMNLENLINQSVEAQNWTLAGIGYAIKSYGWDMLTKIHGELPMKDAFVPGLLAHNYDYQEEIYTRIREWALTAVEYLEMDDKTNYGTKISDNDYIYKGNKEKWIKFTYSILVRNLASLSNKTNFINDYADLLITYSQKAFQSDDDSAEVTVPGTGDSAPETTYNNFWSPRRANLTNSYWQHDYPVQIMTGAVVKYNPDTGDKYATNNTYYPYELADEQIICDTVLSIPGHYDPRKNLKLATIDDANYQYIDNPDSVKRYRFYGSGFTSATGPVSIAPSFYGRRATANTTIDGNGRWLYADAAPYVLLTYAEVQFCVAETNWKMGRKPEALAAFKRGIEGDLKFTGRHIKSGTKGNATGGDKITKQVYEQLAEEYLNGPYVNGMTQSKLTLSHIMMQKYIALFPWGASEAWVDLRKYMYDIEYSGDFPKYNNGWTQAIIYQKKDTDETKVYKGFYLAPALVQGRKGSYNVNNNGSPCFRIRPRYNSEYMWNKPSLDALKPISGMAENYHCSIPWFAYPGKYPESVE